MSLRGKRLRATIAGSLEDTAEDIGEISQPSEAPATVVLIEVNADGTPTPRSCGDDHVAAVNVCRPLPEDGTTHEVERPSRPPSILFPRSSAPSGAGNDKVRLVHHVGGPCDARSIVRCFVLGTGGARGYSIVESLPDAMLLAARLAKRLLKIAT